MIPFLAVSLVIILVLMILIGSFWKEGLPAPIQYILIAVIAIAVTVAAMYFTGAWAWMFDRIYSGGGTQSSLFVNGLFIVIIAAAVVAVIIGAGKAKSGN